MKQKCIPPNDSYPASCSSITANKAVYTRLVAIFRLGTVAYEKHVLEGIEEESAVLFSYVVFSKNAINALVSDETIATDR